MTSPKAQRLAVIGAIATELTALDFGHPVRVAVDGITAAGKTTFADQLADQVRAHGRECLRVTMDGFHHPRATRYRQGRESPDGYYEDGYDFESLRRELLEPLGPSGARRYRTAIIDLASDARLESPTERAADDLIVIVDGSFLHRPELYGGWDRTVFLDCDFEAARARGAARDAAMLGSHEEADRIFRTRYHAAQHRYLAEVDPKHLADVVVTHDDPRCPSIRSYRSVGARQPDPRVDDARAFFAPRAGEWNDRFAEDAPAFTRAVTELSIKPGEAALDVGCGAGRAVPDLASAVGPGGVVLGIDVTIEMLAAARHQSRDTTMLTVADAQHLPLRTGACDVVFAAGLLHHVTNPVLGLVEFARVTRESARLAVFHPVGRAALANKHGHNLRPDDPLDPANLPPLLAAAGWRVRSIDDGPDRYLALAQRDISAPGSPSPDRFTNQKEQLCD